MVLMSDLDSNLLLNLPASLTSEILRGWISLKDNVRLDSAHCNHHLRPFWLQSLRADECIVRELGTDGSIPPLIWLELKDLKVGSIKFGGPSNGNKETEKYLKKFGKYVKDIRVSDGCTAHMKLIASYCTDLTYFKCLNTRVDAHFHHILERNPNIEALFLVGLSDVKLDTIMLPRLHTVVVYCCPFVDDNVILAIAKMSDKITKLGLDGCINVTKAALIKATAQLPTLRSLSIGDCPQFDNAALNTITKTCPLITDLLLFGCKKLTDKGLQCVLQNLSHLRVLDLQGCTALTDQALFYLAAHRAHTLQVLYIGDGMSFSVSAVSWMLSVCRDIRTLVWTAEADITLTEADLERAFIHLREVKTLLLGDGMCCDAALRKVGAHCQQLQHLNLYYNAPDEDAEDEYALPHSAEGVFAVAQGCANLRTVVCSEDNEVLNDLAKKFWKLQRPQITFSTDNDPFCSNILAEPL